MNIGFVPALLPTGGGIHQYSLTMLDHLRQLPWLHADKHFMVLLDGPSDVLFQSFHEDDFITQPYFPPRFYKMHHRSPAAALKRFVTRARMPNASKHPGAEHVTINTRLHRWLAQYALDLIIYPYPTRHAFESGIPYIMSIHDVQHKQQPEFEEVSSHAEGRKRDFIYSHGCRNATLILSESETGRADILQYYAGPEVTEEKIKILPMLPPPYLSHDRGSRRRSSCRTARDLPEKFIFYPAQFWPHKNHLGLVDALAILKNTHGLRIPLVLCGSHHGPIRRKTFRKMMSRARDLSVQRQIIYLGYVDNHEMPILYSKALALTMPTFFGPTNIPVYEAWAWDCAVLTSDIRGIREQVRKAAMLVDPNRPHSIADGIYALWRRPDLVQSFIEQGKIMLSAYTSMHYRTRLEAIIREAVSGPHPHALDTKQVHHVDVH